MLLVVGPFLIPVPPLQGTVAPEELADPDSRFAEVAGVRIHYKEAGSGPLAFVLLHGFGASVFSWREVIGPLAAHGRVVAYDRPAFGLTERPASWTGAGPYASAAQVDQLIGLMDALRIDRAVLVGHSAGGAVSVAAALAHPERVRALVLEDAAIYRAGGAPALLRPLLLTPQARHLCPLLARQIATRGLDILRSAWHDPAGVTQAVVDGYTRPLRANDWDRALCELTLATHPPDLARRLAELAVPTLVITGDDDRIVPTVESRRLASEIGARLVVVAACGHLPHEERPREFMEAVGELARSQGP